MGTVMSEWREYQLGEAINVKHGFAFSGSGITTEETNNILVTPGNFHIGGGFKPDKFKYFLGSYPDNYVLKDGDIVVTMTDLSKEGDTLGYAAKIPKIHNKKLLHNQRIGLVQILSNEIEKDFLYWLLRTTDYQGFIHGAATGTSVRHTSPNTIKQYRFLLPSPSEQKAIAAVLSSLDDKIDLLHRQNQTLEAMAETLFRQWFVFEAQEDWEIVKVGDFVVANEESVNNYNQQFIEYLDTSSLTEGKIESVQLLSFKEAPSRARRLVKHNDVLLSTVRPNQKHFGIIKNPNKNLVVSTGFCVLTCHKIDPHFIYVLLTTDEMTEYLHSIAEGSTSTYPSLKPSDIEKIEFLLPPKNKLAEFAKIASDNWNKIEKNHNQIRTLETLRDTLLPKLMSGEVRVDYG
jgi:type I restriction enzyme, S subunit